jgi:hypothetical protein
MSTSLVGIEDLACSFAGSVWTARKFLVLKAYVDDSCLRQGPVYLLGGGLADGATWANFSNDWDGVLRMSPRIEYFKFAEAINFSGQFAGISTELRNEKMALLFNLLIEHKLVLFSCFVKHEVFEEWYSRLRDANFNNPYILLLIGIARRIVEHCRLFKRHDPIDFHFDNQPIDAEKVYSAWKALLFASPMRYKRYFPHPPNFHDDRSVTPLQAADMIVGVSRFLQTARISKYPLPMPPWGRVWKSFSLN